MASGYLVLPLTGAIVPDGSGSGNNPATPAIEVSGGGQTTNSPKRTRFCWDFTSAEQHIEWSDLALPSDYGSGGKLHLWWKMVTASSGNVNLKASDSVIVDASTDDDAAVYATVVTSGAVAVPGTQGQTKRTELTLTMTNASPNRTFGVMVGSEGTSWTATGSLRLLAVLFEYTKAAA